MKSELQRQYEVLDNMCKWRASQFHRTAFCFVIALIVAALAFASFI